ncbi:MAG: hypothetical protein IKU34_06985 [Clostridia bacterium]|nr:hypothetical protein [Clostridia bacterium]
MGSYQLREEHISRTTTMIDQGVDIEHWKPVQATEKMSDILNRNMGELSVTVVCDLAAVSPAMWYKICGDKVRPGQDVLLRLAFVMGMTPKEAQALLKSGHCPTLTVSRERDVCIIYGLHNRLNLGEMDFILMERGLDPLVPPAK